MGDYDRRINAEAVGSDGIKEREEKKKTYLKRQENVLGKIIYNYIESEIESGKQKEQILSNLEELIVNNKNLNDKFKKYMEIYNSYQGRIEEEDKLDLISIINSLYDSTRRKELNKGNANEELR